MILRFATVTNGELAYRSYKNMEEKVGLPLAHLAEKQPRRPVSYKGLQGLPQRLMNSPMWSGLPKTGARTPPLPTTWNAACPGER